MHLTDLKLRALPFEEGQRAYIDDAVVGLCVRVGKRTKTFLLVIGKGNYRQRVVVCRVIARRGPRKPATCSPKLG